MAESHKDCVCDACVAREDELNEALAQRDRLLEAIQDHRAGAVFGHSHRDRLLYDAAAAITESK